MHIDPHPAVWGFADDHFATGGPLGRLTDHGRLPLPFRSISPSAKPIRGCRAETRFHSRRRVSKTPFQDNHTVIGTFRAQCLGDDVGATGDALAEALKPFKGGGFEPGSVSWLISPPFILLGKRLKCHR